MSQQNPNIKACFTVSKDSPDYERLRQYGRVIACDTKRYRLAVALCDKLISSQTFLNQRNTFYHRHTIVKDLFRFRFVYLQHGVIKDNHANSQAHYKMAVDIFAASAEKEYASLLREEYQLSPKIVKLTGLARYDVLSAEKMPSANKILLAPTWRNVRDEQWDEPHQRFYYQPDFRSSAFYRFYNSILTDPRVLATAERNGFQLELQLHPRLWEQRCDFEESTCVHIIQNRLPLEEELRQTVLLVTDYSSIAFDYAYAYTPILYTQFDRETFYETHGYTRGYFDYEQDGFGPVCLDYESAVETLVQMMNGGCQLDECYRMRIDTFFAFHDKENCRRIYEQILKLPGGIQE